MAVPATALNTYLYYRYFRALSCLKVVLAGNIFQQTTASVSEINASLQNRDLSFRQKAQQLVVNTINIGSTLYFSGNNLLDLLSMNAATLSGGVVLRAILSARPSEGTPDHNSALIQTGSVLVALNHNQTTTNTGYTMQIIGYANSNREAIATVGQSLYNRFMVVATQTSRLCLRLFQSSHQNDHLLPQREVEDPAIDHIPEALFDRPLFRSLTCCITNQPIRYVVVPTNFDPTRPCPVYEKAAVLAVIARGETPNMWPADASPLPLSADSIRTHQVLQNSINTELQDYLSQSD